jgi:hypothetical protein
MQKIKGEGEEEEQWLAMKTTEAGGGLRELLSTVLCVCFSSLTFLFTVFINTVCNSAQKVTSSCFWLSCSLTTNVHGSHKQ